MKKKKTTHVGHKKHSSVFNQTEEGFDLAILLKFRPKVVFRHIILVRIGDR
jgi:hypothetical protein